MKINLHSKRLIYFGVLVIKTSERQLKEEGSILAHSFRGLKLQSLGLMRLGRTSWQQKYVLTSQQTGSRERGRKGPGTRHSQRPIFNNLLFPARPHLRSFQNIPKQCYQLRTKPLTHEHVMVISYSNHRIPAFFLKGYDHLIRGKMYLIYLQVSPNS